MFTVREFLEQRNSNSLVPEPLEAPGAGVEEGRSMPTEFNVSLHGETYHIHITGTGHRTEHKRPFYLTVDGREPGDEIQLGADDSGTLRVSIAVESIAELDRVELLVNGKIAKSWPMSDAADLPSLDATIDMPGSGWIAARAMVPAAPLHLGPVLSFRPMGSSSPITT